MLVIIGPTGNVGAQVADILVNHQPPIPYRLAAHNPQRLQKKYGQGVSAVYFDYDDRTTWTDVLDGVTVLFLIFPLPSPRTVNSRMKPFVDSAVAAGVEHIVYLAVPGSDTQRVVPHYAVERHIEATGVPYTFLHPTYFMQNLCRGLTTHGVDIREHSEIFIPARKGKITFIDGRDVAEVAVKIINAPAPHAGQIYVLSGPELLDFYEVAEVFSEVMEREIHYTNPSFTRFWWRLWRRGIKWDVIVFMTIVYQLTRSGKNAQETRTLEEMLGREPTTLRTFVKDNLFRWERGEWT